MRPPLGAAGLGCVPLDIPGCLAFLGGPTSQLSPLLPHNPHTTTTIPRCPVPLVPQVAESAKCSHCGAVTHKNAYTQFFYNTRVRGRPLCLLGCFEVVWLTPKACRPAMARLSSLPGRRCLGGLARAAKGDTMEGSEGPHFLDAACWRNNTTRRSLCQSSNSGAVRWGTWVMQPPPRPYPPGCRRRHCGAWWHRLRRAAGAASSGPRPWARACGRRRSRCTRAATPTMVRGVAGGTATAAAEEYGCREGTML